MDKLAKALVGFQADMENVTKDATNPFFKSKYATLEAIITAAKPHLKKHGLAVIQFPDGDGLSTMLLHESGEHLQATANLAIKDHTPQGQGSAITYMRRYALSAALGIATEDDDDGNEASKPTQSRQATPQRTTGAATRKPVTLNSEQVAQAFTIPTTSRKDPALELLGQKDRVVSLLKQLGFKPVGKTVAEKRAEVAAAVLKHANAELTDTNLEAIAEILSAKVEQLEAVGDQ
jgi:hypothetical protein